MRLGANLKFWYYFSKLSFQRNKFTIRKDHQIITGLGPNIQCLGLLFCMFFVFYLFFCNLFFVLLCFSIYCLLCFICFAIIYELFCLLFWYPSFNHFSGSALPMPRPAYCRSTGLYSSNGTSTATTSSMSQCTDAPAYGIPSWLLRGTGARWFLLPSPGCGPSTHDFATNAWGSPQASGGAGDAGTTITTITTNQECSKPGSGTGCVAPLSSSHGSNSQQWFGAFDPKYL